MKIIGIAGRSGSGKNTVAGFLAAHLVEQGYRVAMDCIAGSAKRWARENLGWNGERTPFIRDFLQKHGRAVRDSHSPTHWLKVLIARTTIGEIAPWPEYLIIPDICLPEEAELVYQTPYPVVWLVTRKRQGRPALTPRQAEDVTELGVDDIDPDHVALHIRNNDMTLEQLSDYVKKVVSDGRLIP